MRREAITAENADLHQGGFIGGFYVRPMGPFAKGPCHDGHAHKIDHVTNILQGPVLIQWHNPKTGEAGEVTVEVPCKFLVKADAFHRFIALADGVRWECWFAEAEAMRVYGESSGYHLERDDG